MGRYGTSRCPICREKNAVDYQDSKDEKGKYQQLACGSCGFMGKKRYYKATAEKSANA